MHRPPLNTADSLRNEMVAFNQFRGTWNGTRPLVCSIAEPVDEDLPMLGSERARLLAALDLLQNWVSWPSEMR